MTPSSVTCVREQGEHTVTIVTMSREKSPQDPTDTSLPLNERVRAAREREKLGVRQAAKQLKISHPALLKIENGKTNLFHHKSLGTLLKLVEKYKTDFGEEWLTPYLRAGEVAQLLELIQDPLDLKAIRDFLSFSPHHRAAIRANINTVKDIARAEREDAAAVVKFPTVKRRR